MITETRTIDILSDTVILELASSDRVRLRHLLVGWSAYALDNAHTLERDKRAPNAVQVLREQASFIADMVGRLDSAQ